jgi:hypothetical protein
VLTFAVPFGVPYGSSYPEWGDERLRGSGFSLPWRAAGSGFGRYPAPRRIAAPAAVEVNVEGCTRGARRSGDC